MTKTMPCGCRWDGYDLSRCARHREPGSLAADMPARDPVKTKLLVKASDLRARADAPAWMFERAFRYTLGRGLWDVRETVDWLLAAWWRLPASMRSRMCDDIYMAILQGRAGNTYCVKDWERLLTWDAKGEG